MTETHYRLLVRFNEMAYQTTKE